MRPRIYASLMYFLTVWLMYMRVISISRGVGRRIGLLIVSIATIGIPINERSIMAIAVAIHIDLSLFPHLIHIPVISLALLLHISINELNSLSMYTMLQYIAFTALSAS